MKDVEILSHKQWHPLSYFGLEHPFFSIDSHTVINTWIVLAVLILLVILARVSLHYKTSIGRYISLNFMRTFMELCTQSLGYFAFNHITFITSIFTFIVLCNIIAIIPYVEEPTKELNTTLALAIIAFLYIQIYAIKAHGFLGYLKEYLVPFFFMFPLHIVGKISTIISMSFRLFGNIFGGATIVHIFNLVLQNSILFQLIGIFSGLNILMFAFFILFEGFLQAFVFTMLTITYLAIALAHDQTIGEMT